MDVCRVDRDERVDELLAEPTSLGGLLEPGRQRSGHDVPVEVPHHVEGDADAPTRPRTPRGSAAGGFRAAPSASWSRASRTMSCADGGKRRPRRPAKHVALVASRSSRNEKFDPPPSPIRTASIRALAEPVVVEERLEPVEDEERRARCGVGVRGRLDDVRHVSILPRLRPMLSRWLACSDRRLPPTRPRHRGVERRLLVEPERGSELALDTLSLEPGATVDLTDPLHDTLLFAHTGSGSLDETPLHAPASGLLAAGRPGSLRSGPDGLGCVRATLGAATDLHAPMGSVEPVVALDHVEPGKATGARSFQVLHGPHNGSTRATMFVGYIPPGQAPWHYHLYDEIVWVLRGAGRLHIGEDVEELEPGCAFRLHPREVHIVENTDPMAELAVLGIFTPAGSPSAAYLTADVAATYVIAS